MRHACTAVAMVHGGAPPSRARLAEKPVPQLAEYVTSALPMVRTEPTAEDSFAAILDRSKFGMAMAAMIKMIATTIKSSIREKPFCFFILSPSGFEVPEALAVTRAGAWPTWACRAQCVPKCRISRRTHVLQPSMGRLLNTMIAQSGTGPFLSTVFGCLQDYKRHIGGRLLSTKTVWSDCLPQFNHDWLETMFLGVMAKRTVSDLEKLGCPGTNAPRLLQRRLQ